jgi:ribosome maturation protein SDO1
MRVRVSMPTADGKRLREKIIEGAEKIEDDETGQEEWEVVRISAMAVVYFPSDTFWQVMLIDPGQFRVINEILQKECKGRGRIETMSFAATANT